MYFIRQIDAGGCFGLEELVDIGTHRVQGRNDLAQKVTRQVRVSAISNCKVLYMTQSAFMRIFGKYELEKIRGFCEKVDLKDIETRVENSWKHKKQVRKQLHQAVNSSDGSHIRLAPWMQKVQSKKHNLPEINLEENRIKIIETRVKKEIYSDKYERRADLTEKQRAELVQRLRDSKAEMIQTNAEGSAKTKDEFNVDRIDNDSSFQPTTRVTSGQIRALSSNQSGA